MPEIDQYSLTHQELTRMIVRELGLHEGEWMLTVNFSFTAGNVGTDEGTAVPTGIVGVSKIGVTRAAASAPANLVVDAAKVNPATPDE